jgi:hypothetical protein
LLSDRIEKNIEDVLNEVVPPRSQTVPPRAPVRNGHRLLPNNARPCCVTVLDVVCHQCVICWAVSALVARREHLEHCSGTLRTWHLCLQENHWDDLLDSGHDLRLDVAYADFYQEQRNRNAQLPSPLEAPSLFTTLAKQLLDERSAERQTDLHQSAGVQQLFHLVQGVHASVWSPFSPLWPSPDNCCPCLLQRSIRHVNMTSSQSS